MAKISVVIIAKNEEQTLRTCIESVKWADEIVVVDTGSSDKTVEIAKELADTVWFFEWVDDFSMARNYAKSLATHDWIVSIDCDEIIDSENGIIRIKALIDSLQESQDAINVTMWNGVSSKNWLIRVFRKHLIWKWAIHETVSATSAIHSDIVFKYGRSPAHDLDPFLDLRILEKEYAKDPTNTRTAFYLWREYYYNHKYEDAIQILEKYKTMATFPQELTYALYLIARCYWYNQEWQKARDNCMLAIARNPNFKVALELMSEMTFEPNKTRWKTFSEIADNSNCLFTS